MSYKIRPPKLEDYDQINDLGRWFQENSIYATCGWSEKKSLYWVTTGAQSDSNTFMRVAEKDGKIVGFFLGCLTEYFFSEKRIANEMVVVFEEEHRTKIAGSIIRMIRQFELWAKDRDAHEINLGIVSGIAGKGYGTLLKRYGLKEVGQIFKKEV